MDQIEISESAKKDAAQHSEPFSCCDLFRKCSEARKCLMDEAYYENCKYRKNLEAGLIYYGKNAAGFSAQDYEKYIGAINSLSEESKAEYYDILTYFVKARRGAARACWAYSGRLDPIKDAGLISLESCGDFVISRYKNSALISLISGDDELTASWESERVRQETQAKNEGKSFVLRDAFIPWAKAKAPNIVKELDEKFRFVSIPNDIRAYAYEYFIDFDLINSCKSEILTPPEFDSAFLKNI